MLNYALETLQKERELVDRALNNWEKQKYPEARKERERRLNDLNKAILLIQTKTVKEQ